MTRTQELKSAVTKFLKMHAKWQRDNNRPNVDQPWVDALDELFGTFMDGDIPNDCRDMEESVGRLSDSFQQDDDDGLLPHQDRMTRTWTAMRTLERALENMEPEEAKPIESMKDLNAQNVSHEQIARMHGLVDKNGHGKAWLVAQELAKPGAIVDDEGKIKAEYLPKAKDEDRREPKKRPRFNSRRTADRRASQDDEPVCPESPRELWQQQVSIQQAAKMLKKPVDEVKELYTGFDGELADGPDDEKTQNVLELAAAGLSADVIGKKVDMETRTVKAIIKRGKPVAAAE